MLSRPRLLLLTLTLTLSLAAYGLLRGGSGSLPALHALTRQDAPVLASSEASAEEIAGADLPNLYKKLFNESIDENALLAAARERFSTPFTGELAEAHARLLLLQALRRFPASEESLALARRLLRQPEHLLVRREALRLLRPTLADLPESERGSLLADLPPTVVALAARSDRELLGEIWDLPAMARSPQAAEKSLKDWENLPCPSPQQFVFLSTQLNWQGADPYVCDLSPLGKLGRVLRLLESLQLPVEGLADPLADQLRDPFGFLIERTGELRIDLELDPVAVASNKVKSRLIRLGPAFFSNPPLEGLATLIHEARHSDTTLDGGHARCVQGDIPGMQGGCDEFLSQGKTAGAYSYEVYFNLALARSGVVSAADKIYLENQALLLVATRFNRLLPAFAHFQDAILGLDEGGGAFLLHPFARAMVAPWGLAAEKFDRFAYHDASGGAYLFRDGQPALSWSWGKVSENAFARARGAEDLPVAFAGKARLPGSDNPSSVLLDEDNHLRYLRYDLAAGGYILNSFPVQPAFPVREFFLGAGDRTYFLTENGALFRLHPAGTAVDTPFTPRLSDAPPFRQGQGGVLKDSVFLLGQDGVLYAERSSAAYTDYASAPKPETLERLDFQAGAPAVEYREGTQMRALLDEAGDLWLGYHGDEAAPFRIAPEKKLHSFTLMKMLETQGYLSSPGEPRAAFEQRCGLREAAKDPWFHRGVGVVKGQLLFEGDGAQCLPALLPPGAQGQVASFRFVAEEAPAEKKSPLGYFSPVRLEVELRDGKTIRLRPYEGWKEAKQP